MIMNIIRIWLKYNLNQWLILQNCLKVLKLLNLFNLEQIFNNESKIKRKKIKRTSSANWPSEPIWKSDGITGNDSFCQLKNDY